MKNLCIGCVPLLHPSTLVQTLTFASLHFSRATIVAIFPPIIAFFFIDDIVLDNRQNAHDDRDLAGEIVEKESVDTTRSRWRLSLGW